MAGTTIFYFSGTGNSLKVARDLAGKLGGTELVRISGKNLQRAGNVGGETVGIVFPVYYGGLPHMVKEFAGNLVVPESAYVFAVATFGGMPGFSFDLLGQILAGRGIPLAAAFGIPMPGNNQVLYAPVPEGKQQDLFRSEGEVADRIARSILSKEKVPPPPVNFVTRSVFRVFYRRLKPNDRDRHFHADEKCTSCGICARICPAENITLVDGRPEWHHRCEYCLACLQWCPESAIQYDTKTVSRGRYHHPDITVRDLFQD